MARKKKPAPKKRRDADAEKIVAATAPHIVRLRDPNALPFKLTQKQLTAAGQVAYESFVREAGFAKDARIKAYGRLKAFQHGRWERIASDIHTAIEKAK